MSTSSSNGMASGATGADRSETASAHVASWPLDRSGIPLRSWLARQGALLLGGYAAAQGLSFARNAILGHVLSKGDFGIAATLTMMLQLTEVLTDVGADRLIVQDRDGAEPRLAATMQSVLVLRGLVSSLVLLACAPLFAGFFSIPQAAPAFALAALAPLVRGFLHLDLRLAQRQLDNRPQMSVEVLPQLAALLALWPLLVWRPDYTVVAWLALLQAALMVAVSHALAVRPYRLALEPELLRRVVVFGWPIWAAAFPVIAVYQGDRIIVGRLLGMEALAGYSVAFMVTMVPGLLAYKVGNALMLPLLAGTDRTAPVYGKRYAALVEGTALAASLYIAGFVVAGGLVLPVVFGGNYTGLGPVVSCLAMMWAVRMMQAVPNMALMASGETRPLLGGSIIRAVARLPAVCLLWFGFGLPEFAAAGVAGELASLLYVANAASRVAPRLASMLLARALLVVPAATMAMAMNSALPATPSLTAALFAAMLVGVCVAVLAVLALPSLRAFVCDLVGPRLRVCLRT